jgi:hypothetical protein
VSNVVPYKNLRFLRELKKKSTGTAVDKRAVMVAYREGVKMLDDRTTESMAHEFGRRCRGVIPTGSTAA